jgi:hypothetical protein
MADAVMILSWLESLEDLYLDISTNKFSNAVAPLLEAYAILACAPHAVGQSFAMPVSEKKFRALVDIGADESAILALMGPETGYMISRGSNGVCLASIVLPGMTDVSCAEGATFALALISAYLAAQIASYHSLAPRGLIAKTH